MERIQVYRGRGRNAGQWYWRVRAANNRITAIGGEGFHNMDDAVYSADSVTGNRLPIDRL